VYMSDTNKQRFYKGAPMELFAEYNKMTIVFHAGTNPHKARGLRLEYSFEENNCGGVFTDNGILHFDKGFDVFDKTCIYIFEAAPGRNVELSFNITTLGGVENPAMIYGIIPGEKDYLLKNITKEKFVNEVFPFNTIRMLIHANVYLFIRQYKFISTNTDCVREFSSLYGTIKSPNWPLPYSANLNCSWIITAPLGFKIELRIQNFTLEQDCSGDFLEIRNGKYSSSPLIGRYCGDRMPSRITSFANSLFLRFTSDDSVQGRGFHLNWEQTETGCGGKLTSYKGSIHSPVWDSMTTEFSPICNWIIQVAQGSSISLNIKTSIDEFQFCSNNHLRIFDGSSTSSPLLNFDCLTVQTKGQMTLTSTSNQMLILYEASKDSMDEAEFILDYETNCNMVLDHIVGIIESPNFPEPYPELLNCKWDIEAGSKNKVQLAFSHLSLETDSMQCEHDYVEVWDMQDSDVLTKQRLCTHQSQPITSQGNHFRLLFVTDYSNSKNGFRAEYSRQGCGQVLTERVHIITSPNYPHSIDVDCDYYIEVTAGQKIILNVLEFQTDTEMENCDFDALIIKESKKSLLPLLEQCSSRQTGPLTVTSHSNRLYIHYRSSNSGSNKYFKAFYRTEAAQCGGTFIASSGTITSPNFPDLIKQDYKCVWEISVPQENEIQLTIKNIEKTLSDNCTDNYLKISYRSQNATEFRCLSASYQNLLLIPTNTLSVEFVSKSASDGVRFAMAFAKQCGGTIAKDSGVIKANSAENCKWTFNEPEGTLISINILQFDCYCGKTDQAKTECGKRGLGFKVNYFGSDISSANFSKIFCEDYQPNVKFEASKLDIFANNVNFHAIFSTTLHNCGGIILSPRGSLASPNWPSVYPPNVECTWTLTAPSGNSLQLQFEEMDIAKSEGCNEDFLEIRRVIHTQLLGLYCGNQVPEEVLKPSDFYWIRFRSSEGSSGKGFKLKWSYAHLNEIVNETKGLIKSPAANTISNEDEPFVWRIVVENGKFIKLEFEHYSEGLLNQTKLFKYSSSNYLTIKYVLILPRPLLPERWNLTYREYSDCNEEYRLVPEAATINITSPNYPHSPHPHTECEWRIVAPPGEIIKVEFEDSFDFNARFCIQEYIELFDGSTSLARSLGKYCYKPPTIRTTQNILTMHFLTDINEPRGAFKARISIDKCGASYSSMRDVVKSPGYPIPGSYPSYSQCDYAISLPGPFQMRLIVEDIHLPFDSENPTRSDHLEIIPLGAPNVPATKFIFGNFTNSTDLEMSTNKVIIRFHTFAKNAKYRGFRIAYRSPTDSNRQHVVGESGVLIMKFPERTQFESYKKWRIEVPKGLRVRLEMLNMDELKEQNTTVSLVYEHVASSKTTHPVLVFAAGAITVNYRQNLTQVLQPSNQEIGYYLIAQSEYERIRRLTMSYRLHKCGGHMLVDRLNTAHPKETDLNYGAIMCVWTLSNPPYLGGGGSEHRLFGNFSFSEGCDREFVLIRERRWDAEPTKKICKDNQDEFDSFVVKSSLTFIVYQAENYSSQKTNFFMRTRKTLLCGSETSVTNFLSAVQVDFAHYENNQECSWVFYTEQGKYLQITFYNRFFIEASENCTKDYLEVQNYVDGLWIPGQRFCGRELPPAYNSTTHRLRLVFRTNEAVRGDGFTLNVRSQCSVTLNVTSELRTIESPYSSGMGATRLRCDYVFKSNEIGKLISVRAIYNQEFSPPLQSGCMFGFTPYKLNATGQEQAVKTHCETNFEERAYYYLKLSYVAYSAARYTIEYGLDSCGGNISTTATIIRPLKHESSTNGYAENMNCVWYVTAPDDRSIAVQFKYFDTEKDFDHVSIYAGHSIEQDKLVQQLSGNLTDRPPTLLVESNLAVINAISDVSNSAKGFQAMVVFLPNCNERISLTEGNSPLNLARTFKLSTGGEQYICHYRLNAPKGYRVGVNVKKIQLNHDLVNCHNSNHSCARGLCNSVEIFDSLAMGQLSMGKFCQTANLSMVSSYEDAMVKFVAKKAGQLSFEILLTLEKSACGPTTEFQLNDKENLTLTFPLGNVSTYGANMHCNWFIRSNKSLEFLFTYIDLQNVSQVTDKCLDYIQIKYRDTTDTICGRSSHYSFTVDEHLAWEVLQYSNVEIVFHSDDQIEGRGFELKVGHQEVGNRFFNQLSASITAYYETSIGNNTITVPENYNLNFFITVGYIPRQEECDPKKFFIIDLKINETIFNLCERYRDFSIPLYTTTNTVRVESMRSSAVQTLNYWVSDKKDPLGCGGILQSRKGSIMSPPYGNDHNYSECIWNITLPPPNGISLYIESFDMGSETNCHLNNLKIFDIMDDGTEKLLKSLCGLEESAQLVISKSNRIAVVSRKSPNFDGTGWSLSYQPKEPWMVD
uniref:CUB domain-containing protein n=1 Tax=Stomoxys calcitrans TaxID=35570 RepID=A0A1I8NQJ8_STOCA